jgi:hypothetical protein
MQRNRRRVKTCNVVEVVEQIVSGRNSSSTEFVGGS